jgi:hypothetical protein
MSKLRRVRKGRTRAVAVTMQPPVAIIIVAAVVVTAAMGQISMLRSFIHAYHQPALQTLAAVVV